MKGEDTSGRDQDHQEAPGQLQKIKEGNTDSWPGIR